MRKIIFISVCYEIFYNIWFALLRFMVIATCECPSALNFKVYCVRAFS
jgi:hypothetical protein